MAPTKPRKTQEYNLFLDLLKSGPIEHLNQIAEVLNVDAGTISEWNKRPEVIEAKAQGVKRALSEMEKAGKRDWRMWESKLKMLGLNPAQRTELTGKDGGPIEGKVTFTISQS